MLRIALRVLAVLAVFAFTVFLIPSSVPFAGAEEAIPEYEPVELAATSVEPLEMGEIAPYAPLKSGFLNVSPFGMKSSKSCAGSGKRCR